MKTYRLIAAVTLAMLLAGTGNAVEFGEVGIEGFENKIGGRTHDLELDVFAQRIRKRKRIRHLCWIVSSHPYIDFASSMDSQRIFVSLHEVMPRSDNFDVFHASDVCC